MEHSSPTRGATKQDVAAHAASLRRLARRLVGDDAADDLVQDTWTAALRSRPSRQLPIWPWLIQVLRNFVRMGGRRRRLHAARASDVVAAAQPGEAAGSPDELLERLEAKRLLLEELGRLPEPYRATVLLRYFEDLPAARIARQHGVPAGTVRWRLKRGIEMLRAALDARAGGRDSWMLALLPLSRPPAAGTGLAAALEGGIILSSKTKLGLAVAALLLALAGAALVSTDRGGPASSAGVGPGETTGERGRQLAPARWAGEGTADPAGGPASSAVIEALVLGPDGAPLAGAGVVLSQGIGFAGAVETDLHRPRGAISSDAQGRVRFGDLAAGGYALTATLPRSGLAPAVLEGVQLGRGQRRSVRLALGRGGFLVTGLVRESGAGAVPGARVTAALAEREGEPGAAAMLFATASAEGGYALSLAAGRYLLRAEADGYAVASDEIVVAADIRKDLRLEPGAAIAGRVLARQGRQPVPGATVQARLVEGWSFGRSPQVAADAQGAFRLAGLGPGDFLLEARAGGRAGRTGRLRLQPGQALADVIVELDAGFVLAGRVLAADGAGVAAARVTALARGGSPPAEVTSGAGGRYRLEGLLAGSYELAAWTADGASAHRWWLALERDLVEVDLRLEAQVSVQGQVVDGGGRPVAGARVLAATEPNAGWVSRITPSTTTGADGRFRFLGLNAGMVVLQAEHPEAGTASWDGHKLSAGSVHEVVLRLQAGASLSGAVSFADGSPAPGAVVYAAYRERLNKFIAAQNRARMAVQGVAGADGRYVLRGLAAGKPRVSVSRSGGALRIQECGDEGRLGFCGIEVTLAEGEHRELDLTVPGALSVAGRVLAPDGRPAAGALVMAAPGQAKPVIAGRAARASTDHDGRFVIDNLDAGQSYTLWADQAGFSGASVAGVLAGRQDVRLQLAPESSVSGVVVDQQGRAVADFELQMSLVGGPRDRFRFADVVEVVHDANGAFEARALAPGSYKLQVRTLARTTGFTTFVLARGERRRDLRVVVEGPVTVLGRLVDGESGAALAGITVSAVAGRIDMPLGYARVEAITDTSGGFRLPGVWRHDPIVVHVDPRDRPFRAERRRMPPPAGAELDMGTVRLPRNPVR